MQSRSEPEACPHLGRLRDPETYYSYASNQNFCHAGESPAEVSRLYQDSTCLGGDWTACRFFGGGWRPSAAALLGPSPDKEQEIALAPVAAKPSSVSRFPSLRHSAAVLLVVASAMLGVGLYFVIRALTGAPTPAPLPVADAPTASAIPSLAPVPTATLSPTPHATTSQAAGMFPTADATETSTPTPTPSHTPTREPTRTETAITYPTVTATSTQTYTATPSPSAAPSGTLTPSQEPTVSPTPTPTAVTSPWNVVHVVQSGESLSAVAVRYRTTATQLASANGIVNLSLIYTGQLLTIPVRSPQDALGATPVLTGSIDTLTTTEPITLPVPTLSAPDDGTMHTGAVQLRWDWPSELDTGQYFAVHVWWDQQQTPTYLSFTRERVLSLDLGARAPGLYWWDVRLADVGQLGGTLILRRFLSPAGERSGFTWSGQEP